MLRSGKGSREGTKIEHFARRADGTVELQVSKQCRVEEKVTISQVHKRLMSSKRGGRMSRLPLTTAPTRRQQLSDRLTHRHLCSHSASLDVSLLSSRSGR